MTVDEIKADIDKLSDSERFELEKELLGDLSVEDKAELDRRLQAMENGTAVLMPAEEAIANACAKLHAKHPV